MKNGYNKRILNEYIKYDIDKIVIDIQQLS